MGQRAHGIKNLTWVIAALFYVLPGTHLNAEPLVKSQEELLHKQNSNPGKPYVHAEGVPADTSKSFSERYAPPKDFTSYASEPKNIDWLFRYVSWTGFIYFCLMFGAILLFSFAYRSRPGHKAVYGRGTSKKDILVSGLLVASVFVSMDLVLDHYSLKQTQTHIWKYPPEETAERIMVMPQQWAWNFKYAGQDGKFGTSDDIDTVNEMRIPKGKPILLQIKSKDVIHGFFIPQVRHQVDALPGVITKFWFDANTVGDYELACYHHCGTSHYKMKAFVKVMEPTEYTDWISENSRWALAKFDPEDKQVSWGWNWTPDTQNKN